MVVAVPHPTIARDHCLAPARSIDASKQGVSGKYGRLFPEVAPFTADEEFLIRLGQREGPCDSGPDTGDDDAGVAAGWPLLGQFIAHDITADRSLLLQHADADHIANFHTPRANLECLYGDGPVANPFLYDRDDPAKLLIGSNDQGAPADLRRNAQGIALIGDPRNDVHLFVSQLHLAMLQVHNLLVDRLREDGEPEAELFDAARRATTWHYQWIIVNDFLPTLVGREPMDELLAEGPRYYKPEGAADLHPVGVRRRRLPLRPQPDPPRLPPPGRRPGAAAVPRPAWLPAGGRQQPGRHGRSCSRSLAGPLHSRARRSTGAWRTA